MKDFLKKFPQLKIICVYFVFYCCFFLYLESRNIIIFDSTTFIDSYIPFCEYFVIFYLFWFIYVILGVLYFTFIEPTKFNIMAKYLMIGMTICLLIDLILPNGISLRPTLANENIFQILVSLIYSVDTSTNVFPSIHVYNSIVIGYGFHYSYLLKDKIVLQYINITIVILICMSTVMLKQHAFLDIIAGILLAYVVIKSVNKKARI